MTTSQTSAGRVTTDSAGRGSLPGSHSARPAEIHPAAAAMSERQLEDGIRRILADLPAVIWYHPRIRGEPEGFPDLVRSAMGSCSANLRGRRGGPPRHSRRGLMRSLTLAATPTYGGHSISCRDG